MKTEILSLKSAEKLEKYDKTIKFLKKKIKDTQELDKFFNSNNLMVIRMAYQQILYYLENGRDVMDGEK